MDEIVHQLVSTLRGIWQRRWIGLAVAWLVGVAGALFVVNIPDRYEATARIFVDTQSVLRPLMRGLAIESDVSYQLAMLARTLISRPNMEKLMQLSGLDSQTKTERDREAVIDALVRNVRLSGMGRENMYSVAYRDVDPVRAELVVRNLVSMFVDSGIDDKRRDSEAARRFIDEQIAQYEKKLEEAENRNKEFQLKNFGFLGGAGKDYFTRLTELTGQLNGARLELRAAEQSRDALKRELEDESPLLLPDAPAAELPPRNAELDARIEAQRRQLDDLMRRYTDQHPDVVSAQRLIAQLEQERNKDIEARKRAAQAAAARGFKASGATNPVFQQIKVSLAAAEANVAALRARVAESESRVRELRASAERVPKVEAELAQLNRDYDVLRRNYEQLVQRREAAALSEDVGQVQGIGDFRLIDPPRASSRPVFPDRLSLVSLVLAAAIGAGLVAAFAVAQVFPTVQEARTLREISSRPVLGTVSMLASPATTRRNRLMHGAFGSAAASLVGLYGAWIAWIAWTLRG